MTDTRGPGTGKVPPHVQERLEAKRRKREERARKGPTYLRPPAIAAYVVVALLIGLGIGLGLAGDPQQEVADVIEAEVAPLANEADALWRVGRGEAPAISEAAAALESTNDATAIEEHLQTWVDAHQGILDELAAVEVQPLAGPLRELYRGYVRAQLDGVVLLGAAAAHDAEARQELLRAAVREFGRARELLGEARSALAELGGPTAPQVQVPTVPGLTRPGQPLPSPFSTPPTEGTDGTDAPTDEAAGDGTDGEATDEEATQTDEATPSPSPS